VALPLYTIALILTFAGDLIGRLAAWVADDWPAIDNFKSWHQELGKSEQEMADLAGISREEYTAAEASAEAGKVNGQICAFIQEARQGRARRKGSLDPSVSEPAARCRTAGWAVKSTLRAAREADGPSRL
jgi:DNA-binding XRE family transcriptional regulator